MGLRKCLWGGIFLGFLTLIQVDAKVSERAEIWMLRQDFVKFGKKEAYEMAEKENAQAFSQFIGSRETFGCYAFQVLDSPAYVYLTPIGSYSGIDRLAKQQLAFQESYGSQEWNARMLARASTMNFFFTTLQKFLPDASCMPKAKDKLASLPYAHLYWIGISPGQEGSFEQHLSDMAQLELEQENPTAWHAWRETVGGALPQYVLIVFGATEDEVEKSVERLDFVSGPYKQILRKQKQAKAVLRTDLSLQ